ncbi:hypothetical protein [Nannocystis sp. SCPEA4]|uniref:hypothetical protein n=1 Tax=Nannocystis sp. SCPEA4 TaxID=2996787 RepID=UPI0022716E9D|nr:hypothetical protein [Nannocystis sp. SCPEA4]MCY1057628.1 hypothetical protein [Nannocystis sp. SCPEA4]
MHRAHALRSLCVAALWTVACRPSPPTEAPASSSASDCNDSHPCPPQPAPSATRDCGDSRPCPPATDCHDSPNCAQAASADPSTTDIDHDGVPDDRDRCPTQIMLPGPLCDEDPARAQGCPCDCRESSLPRNDDA